MIRQLQRRLPGPAGMFALSFAIHVAVFLVIWKSQYLSSFHPVQEPVTYVDLMALPVASPQSGTPAPAAPSAPPAPAPPAAPAEMALPAPRPKAKAPAANAKVEKPAPRPEAKSEKPKVDESREFNERMANLQRRAEERNLAGALHNIEKRVGAGRVGMPGAKGTQAGSDYASYVNSRLQDAFRQVMVSQGKAPQLYATITIAPDGTIADYRFEKPSGDATFDDSVARAITLAGKSLKPPPTGKPFKGKYRFRPEGVGVR